MGALLSRLLAFLRGLCERSFRRQRAVGADPLSPSATLYSVLGVDESADDAALRKAYRKLLLSAHPDKGGDAALFLRVQHAYEVLSDAGERAAYDAERLAPPPADDDDAAGGPSGCVAEPADEFDVAAYESESAYEHLAGERGFYAVYASVFEALARQEGRAAELCGRAFPTPPGFGDASTPYSPSVAAFYDCWLCFTTLKEFDWLAAAERPDAAGRKDRRLQREEERKLRSAARRDHSAAVRSLAAFVRRRDPRYGAFAAAAEEARAAREAERERRQVDERAQRLARAREYEQAEARARSRGGACTLVTYLPVTLLSPLAHVSVGGRAGCGLDGGGGGGGGGAAAQARCGGGRRQRGCAASLRCVPQELQERRHHGQPPGERQTQRRGEGGGACQAAVIVDGVCVCK